MNNQAIDGGEIYRPGGGIYGSFRYHVTNRHGGVEGQYLVRSQGWVSDTRRQVEVVIRRVPAELPDFLAAITLYNPNLLANFSGTPPNVCGLDTNLPTGMAWNDAKASDCVPGSGDGPDAVGVGVHDDQSVVDIIDALGSRAARVTGTDGSGGVEEASVYNLEAPNPTGKTDPLTAVDVVNLADEFAALADYIYDGQTWCNGEGQPDASGNFGTVAAPKVVVIRNPDGGTLHLSGCSAGVGILVIDCEVRFTGTFNYAGLVMITRRGEATVDVDLRGTPLIMGSMVAANPMNEATSVLDLRGTADVFFSREALALAQLALSDRAKFETLFYREKQPNDADFQFIW